MDNEIGPRLREARTARGSSLRSVAQAVGVSASLLSQVETGKTQPSVSTLYAIVNHLGISLDDLLGIGSTSATSDQQASGAAPTQPPVQRSEDNPVLEMENGVRWERLAGGLDDATESLLVTYAPGAASSIEGKLMRHSGVEFAYLVEGELTLQLEFDTYVLRPGDSLQFDSVRPHLYHNHGDVPARGIWVVIGRRAQNLSLPAAPQLGEVANGGATLTSAVDVLAAMERLQPQQAEPSS
ncbi:cupin domain-containing protein [Nocardioides sp.]|uniref:cupin domain-containing protein n=1 Tax=Nocardioides sp. TaxID=35761 RepID=UPI003527B8A2